MNEMTIVNLLKGALLSDYGVSLSLSTAYLARYYRRKFYAERERLRGIGIKDYDELSFLVRNQTELWVVRRGIKNPPSVLDFQDYRALKPSELPPRILSRGKSRVMVNIS